MKSRNYILLAMKVVSLEFDGTFLRAIDETCRLSALTRHFDNEEEKRLGKLVSAMAGHWLVGDQLLGKKAVFARHSVVVGKICSLSVV